MSRAIYLVGCSSRKVVTAPGQRIPARDLYASQLFRSAYAYASARGEVRILSAGLGLLKPSDLVATYDRSMRDLDHVQREAWARKVCEDLAATSPASCSSCSDLELVILAGEAYVMPLRRFAWARNWRVSEPLARMQIGQRLAFLATANREGLHHVAA